MLFNSLLRGRRTRHSRTERGLITRPGIAEVAAYRRHVDAAMLELLAGDVDPALADLVVLGLPPRAAAPGAARSWTSSTCCPATRCDPAYGAAAVATAEPAGSAGWIEHDGGIVEIGHAGDGFAFDNEGPRHEALLRPFRVATALVTNGDWLAFIADGGYARPELWMSDGWAHRPGPGLGGSRVLAAIRRRVARVRPRRPRARSTRPRPSSTSAGTRPTPTPAGPAPACRPRPSGRRRPRRPTIPTPAAGTAPRGSGRRARTSPIPGSSRRPARSVSTTASSWSTSRCCGAALASRRPATPAAPTATSSRPSARWAYAGLRLAE